MRWHIHFDRPVNEKAVNQWIYEAFWISRSIDPFMAAKMVQAVLKNSYKIGANFTISPEFKEGVSHEMQGLWGRN